MIDFFVHDMPWGGQWRDGVATFHVWAPAASSVQVELEGGGGVEMRGDAQGRWQAQLSCDPGVRYRFAMLLEDGAMLRVADPASRAQAGDVDDASIVIDPGSYRWVHSGWAGRPWTEAVIYELHVGLIGGFRAVEQQLAALKQLGVTAVELMPVADFPGPRNWGYDGVLPFAPDASYGTPDDLKKLVDTAHGLGMMVFLDVVYNHFGPDGNYLGRFAPEFFHRDNVTAWGGAINFSNPQVRSFFTENACYWINEYRFDGLRIDAAHAIHQQDWLVEMANAVRTRCGRDRQIHLVLEHDANAAGLLIKGFDAQWNDDAHHVLHTLLTGENDSYYADYTENAAAKLARMLSQGFIYQGDPSRFRQGERRGEPSSHLPPSAFVFFLQNHDQTGNRAFGDRLTNLANPAALRAAQALQLLTPHIPLIFMGEESASTTPFLYFTSHRTQELADAVRKGRWQEFAATKAFADEKARETIADPNAETTFERSRVDSLGDQDGPATAYVKQLLAIRRQHIVPNLGNCRSLGATVLGPAAVAASWRLGSGELTLVVNLADQAVHLDTVVSALSHSESALTIFESGEVRSALLRGTLPAHGFLACIAACS